MEETLAHEDRKKKKVFRESVDEGKDEDDKKGEKHAHKEGEPSAP